MKTTVFHGLSSFLRKKKLALFHSLGKPKNSQGQNESQEGKRCAEC